MMSEKNVYYVDDVKMINFAIANSIIRLFALKHSYTVEHRFRGPQFASQDPTDQTFHYISLLQKPRF